MKQLLFYITHNDKRCDFLGDNRYDTLFVQDVKHNALQHFDAIELKSGEEKTLYDWNDKILKTQGAV